ncbi:hypothetical protein QQP08_012534, partial [Theobroma cacao]
YKRFLPAGLKCSLETKHQPLDHKITHPTDSNTYMNSSMKTAKVDGKLRPLIFPGPRRRPRPSLNST